MRSDTAEPGDGTVRGSVLTSVSVDPAAAERRVLPERAQEKQWS